MQWSCGACGHVNGAALVCDACGVARRHFEDPPLDIPRRPAWLEIGAAYLTATYAALAIAGATALAAPRWLERLGIAPHWVALEVILAGGAAYGSWIHALWLRRFNVAELSVPRSARTGAAVDAVVTLVPYETLERVWVTVELVDRSYVRVRRRGRNQVETRTRVLSRFPLQEGEPLQGRRQHRFVATFAAPVPSPGHTSVQAEITASLAGFLAPLVPGLGLYARNLRAHGGYFVRARIRTGVWRRSYEEQVVSVTVPAALLARAAAKGAQAAGSSEPTAATEPLASVVPGSQP
jgi:hypothetical protein